jgi:alkyl hydroperoxide reductase subunit AhpC
VLLGISADSPFSHAEFKRQRGVAFPLLSDMHRATIRDYGVWDEARNVAYRSTFIVDRQGRLRWGQAGDRHMVRGADEILRVLSVVDDHPDP